jgi:aryl-alcohol dehydrogenase-like predicted oxidoreductase
MGIMEDPISLGKTDIRISPIGLGTWQWGDRVMWSYGTTHTDRDIHEAFRKSIEGGIDFFDTAELYGKGRSETLLGECLREMAPAGSGVPVVVATKFAPLPYRLRKGALAGALRRSLARLGLARVDLYQIHFPFSLVPVAVWANALADAVEAGLTRSVGVSNYSAAQIRQAHQVLSRRGIPLASNQVEYHLLHRKVERDGVLQTCRELGVALIAYSPLAKGLLTGKYTPENHPPGLRKYMARSGKLNSIQPLLGLMREVGQAHAGRSPAQVALNWLVCKGAVPIPGAKNAHQARENAAATGWRLDAAEIAALDEMSR